MSPQNLFFKIEQPQWQILEPISCVDKNFPYSASNLFDSADMLILLLRWNPISYIYSLLRSTLGRSMSRVRVSLVRLHIRSAADPLSKHKVRSTKLKWTSIYTFSHTRKLSKHTCCAAAIIKQQRFSGFCRAQLVNVSESDKELVLLGQSTILS